MEYVPGGDFRTLLNNSGVLKEEHARFYISEMFVGVNELHKLGYIHRDLKPEVCKELSSHRLSDEVVAELPRGWHWTRQTHRLRSCDRSPKPTADRIAPT